jgi:hypothetical protein
MPKYRIPIEVKKVKHYFWGYTVWEYKLYSDDQEKQFAKLKLFDIDGFVVGFHTPVEFTSIYVKAASQAKTSARKAMEDAKAMVGTAAIAATAAGNEIKTDAEKLAREAGKKTSTFFGKVRSLVRKE